jgi:formylglycine-generating enzyme required for sulfatase activity/serine/threonine protein kinase
VTVGAAGSPITPPGPGLPSRYEVRSSLGKGGMGRVYLCYDSILDATLAVKVLAPQYLEDAEAVEAIRNEARQVFKFHDCSNILRLHNFDQHEGNWYLVMEYAEGGSLDGRLKREGRFPEGEVRRLGAEVAEALDFSHRHKVLHRDVKPANILLDRTGRVKVGDFGIAKLMEGVSAETQHITGTPVYMAPEQILRLPMDGRTDQYALGCMVFEMAAGVRPYTGSQAQIFLEKVGPDARVPDLREVAPHVSADLAAIVRRSMSLLRDERYPSCAEMAAALRVGAAEAPMAAPADGGGATITQSTAGDLPTAPLAGKTANFKAATEVIRPAAAPKSRLPLVFGGVGVLAAAVVALALLWGGKEAPKPPAVDGKPPAPADTASGKSTEVPPKPPDPKPPVDGFAKEPGKLPPIVSPKETPKPADPPPPGPNEKAPPPPPEPTKPPKSDFVKAVADLPPPPDGVLAAQRALASLPTGFHRDSESRIWCDKDGAEMVLVPAGEFTMGSDDGDPDEKPAHKVKLGPYLVDRHEVTVAQYRRFCDATGRALPADRLVVLGVPEGRTPVVAVPWADAAEYAQWVGKALPTEAQWEKAARGSDSRRFPWGDQIQREWFNAQEPKRGMGDGERGVAAVGRFPNDTSPFGCLDMAGNVSEWCADWYDEKYYASSPPGEDPKGPASAEKRSVRGGSYYVDASRARAAARDSQFDNLPKTKMGVRQSVGFRCVRRLP